MTQQCFRVPWHSVFSCVVFMSCVPMMAASPRIDDLETPAAGVNDWPWFRGPQSNNVCQDGQRPPMHWSDTQNILWRVTLPGQGHATPCIKGTRLFVPVGDKDEETISMICLDRDTGEELWQTQVYHGKMAKIHKDTTYAAATPACDGTRVFFSYQTDHEIRMAGMTLNGTIVWDKALSPYTSIQGFSASPVFYKSAVIVPTDGKNHNRLTAMHRVTGQIIWQTDVPAEHENYASATRVHVAGRDQIILVGPDHIRSYNPDTGQMIWVCDGPAMCYVAVAVADENTVYATGGYPKRAMLAIRADGTGNITHTHVTWKSDNKAGYVPTPLLHNGLITMVNDQGLYRCYEASTGKVLNETKLEGGYYSSPVLAGDSIYLFNKTGKAYVFKADSSLRILAQNDLPHGVFATPVICGSRIFLRTLETLYCLAKKPVAVSNER
ncbi:MAG: PQQ-binding-like beta-propeller repeat protein [Planctomycetes bacterium]|nr:PQQ-binding-like beta-propeller repeat protein [Planctomycetota bacterium]